MVTEDRPTISNDVLGLLFARAGVGLCFVAPNLTVLRANATRFHDPDASGPVTMLKPEGVNAPPKIAPTSGRDTQTAFAPRNTGAPPAAGYAQTWTASTPVPDGAAASIAHPPTVNPDVTVEPGRGVSTNMKALDSTLTVTLFDCSAPDTVLWADTTKRQVPAVRPRTTIW